MSGVNVHPVIVGAIVSVVIGLQAWTLLEVVNLKVRVEVLWRGRKVNKPDESGD